MGGGVGVWGGGYVCVRVYSMEGGREGLCLLLFLSFLCKALCATCLCMKSAL